MFVVSDAGTGEVVASLPLAGSDEVSVMIDANGKRMLSCIASVEGLGFRV